MIEYRQFTMENGLRVVMSQDIHTALCTVNVLYAVGSKHDPIGKSGLAHFFEHMMFTGTAEVGDYDDLLQMAAGEGNAFTNQDITNYYSYAPADNLELLLYLEADRMKNLIFPKEKFETQKKVILEEYEESMFATPYSDFWQHLGRIAFPNHAYQWPTIGTSPEEIYSIQLHDIQDFYAHINPQNTVLSICGRLHYDHTEELVRQYFSSLKPSPGHPQPTEVIAKDTDTHTSEAISREMPEDCVFLAFPMVARSHPDYYVFDVLSELLCYGKSAPFYSRMTRELEVLNEFDAWLSGNEEEGLFVIEMHLDEKTKLEDSIQIFWSELDRLLTQNGLQEELTKIKNKIEMNIVLSETSIVTKAMSLAYYEHLGCLSEINNELQRYDNVTVDDLRRIRSLYIVPDQAKILMYQRPEGIVYG